MKNTSQHTEWLSMVEVSGPFLAISLLEKVFPQGLDAVEAIRKRRARTAYEEWRNAIDEDDSQLKALHQEWVRLVLSEILEFDEKTLFLYDKKITDFTYKSPEHAGIFSPDLLLGRGQTEIPFLFVSIQPPGTDLEKVKVGDDWPVSIVDRMTLLCRAFGVRLGLVTNGERWMLVNAPTGNTSGHVSWYARLWFQEPITLKAFQSLLGARRWFGPKEKTLSAMLEDSLQYHEEITDTLGEQVRRAVEVLVQCLDKADQDRNRELLHDVSPTELYEAGLSIMMRLVFVLCAEERGLLLLGDTIYDQYYAVSTLRGKLAEEADKYGPEILERRHDAWARLLAVFRAVYGGIEQETLRMPALGGSLLDPDRFPFLEGRAKGSHWQDTSIKPLPIDNRTVLLLLNALQILEQGRGALMLSYKALDVEQIGHVYEGLLEYTVERLPQVTLGLEGSQKAKNPNLTLDEIENAFFRGREFLSGIIREVTQRSDSAIENALEKDIDETVFNKVISACTGDIELANRIRPFTHLLRKDAWGEFIIYKANSFAITLGVDRRETGTHYTPKSLTEDIVERTLEPIVYVGPSEGVLRKDWRLKSSVELLDLKICDPAMGSGAFLVQVCRWLAERLVEAWGDEENSGKFVTVDGNVIDSSDSSELMPKSLDDRLLIARRLISEKCLYGVDSNPLAVELSKLSIWLITLAKGRPFGFLDHNLRHGDSLVGIYRLEQITKLNIDPEGRSRFLPLFQQRIEASIIEAVELRKKVRETHIRDIHDIEIMAQIDKEARNKLEYVENITDAMIGEALRLSEDSKALEIALDTLSTYAIDFLQGNGEYGKKIVDQARQTLAIDLVTGKSLRKPFHWPLEFPEVFMRDNPGFDGMVGNPPFVGGRRMRGAIGSVIMNWLALSWPHASMNADFCAFFYLKGVSLIRTSGSFGFLATKTVGQGDTARTGLSHLIENMNCVIIYARSSFVWPGTASVIAALVIGQKGPWKGMIVLDDREVNFISPILDSQKGWGEAKSLSENISKSFQGSVLVGLGFVLTPQEADFYLQQREVNQEVVKPYLGGEDLNSHPEQKASRWAIDFRDATLEECQKKWPELIERILNLVKPQRDMTRREAHRKYWWHHGDKRPALYESLKNRSETFVIARVTKYVAIVSVPARQIFHDKVYVFDLSCWSNFCALQCSFHEVWARRGSSTVGETLNYTPSDYFDTYPFLHIENTILDSVGKEYHDLRRDMMIANNEGLTDTYNGFHNPGRISADFCRLRELHIKMDRAVAAAYGWDDIRLDHEFRQTKQGMRFTISDEVKYEVLQRLLRLNLKCYEEDCKVARNQIGVKKSPIKPKKEMKVLDSTQVDLFIRNNK